MLKPNDYGRLGVAVRDEVIDFFGRFACINAVAALVDVAELHGGRVLPLTVRAFIFNPRITRSIGDVTDPKATERLKKAVEEGGVDTVALGLQTGSAPLPRGEWAGHLVGVIEEFEPNRALVIDPTLEQANQPDNDIVLRPLFLKVKPDHLSSLFRVQIDGCEVQYKAFPQETFFMSTPAWRNMEQREVLRDRVLGRLEAFA